MSPEAVTGRALDHRSDLFSVGVIAWELLAGRRLFKGESDADVVRRICEGELHPPSMFNEAVTRAEDAVVMRALGRARAERWQSAAELRGALEPMLRAHRDTADVVEWKSRLLPTQVVKFVELDVEVTESDEIPRPKFVAADTVVSRTRTDED